jgi:hypothetical protein
MCDHCGGRLTPVVSFCAYRLCRFCLRGAIDAVDREMSDAAREAFLEAHGETWIGLLDINGKEIVATWYHRKQIKECVAGAVWHCSGEHVVVCHVGHYHGKDDATPFRVADLDMTFAEHCDVALRFNTSPQDWYRP